MRREKGGKEQPFNKEEKQQHHQSKQEHRPPMAYGGEGKGWGRAE
jgi:hypothetical protein